MFKAIRWILKWLLIGVSYIIALLVLLIVLNAGLEYMHDERVIAECEEQSGVVMWEGSDAPYCMEKKPVKEEYLGPEV